MRRAVTTFVALLVSILLLSHIGLPHCANARSEAAATSSAAADSPADRLIHVSDLDAAARPDRHGHDLAVSAALAVAPDALGAAIPRPGTGAESDVFAASDRSARSILQVYRC